MPFFPVLRRIVTTVGAPVAALVLVAMPAHADLFDPPAGYYASAEGLAGPDLEAALHDIIDDHTVVAYSWPPFLEIDESASNNAHIDLIYSDGTRAKALNGGGVGEWNREHLWPRSFGIFNDGGADNSDLFNLRPSDVQVNSERGSLIFEDTDPGGEIPLQFSAPGCSKDADSWEPRDDEKGDIARACFYMDVRYDGSDPITTDLELADTPNASGSRFGNRLTLLRWHLLDPPDASERKRNHAIFSGWQGNRNPFIDRPEFAAMLFLAEYPLLDDDADGLPDWWEFRVFGSLIAGAGDDTDGDHAAALLEFASASNPLDSNDRPPTVLAIGGDVTFTYRWASEAATAGVSATVEMSDDLSPGSWAPAPIAGVTKTSIGAGLQEVSALLDTQEASVRQFYRLSVSAP